MGGFEVAICSKCERREDTGFIEEPSRLSSGVSSISKVVDTGRAYELIDYRPIWVLTMNS